MKLSQPFRSVAIALALICLSPFTGCRPADPSGATAPAEDEDATSATGGDKNIVDRLRGSSERELIISVAEAIRKRDLKALQTTAAPELAAELARLHDKDTALFWKRGQVWVSDVASGFKLTHREDDTKPRWHVLVEFDNGRAERVTFTRVDGGLRLDDL